MKKTIRIAAAAAALAAGGVMASRAEVRWLNPEYDFGAFKEDLGSVDAVFEMVNEGEQPVRIISARATCGCTVPKYDEGEIQPGDTARVNVTYLANGRPGRFDKHVYVKTSDDPSVQRTLTIKGTVIGASNTLASRFPVHAGLMQLRTASAGFGDVKRGRLKTLYIDAYNLSTDTLTPELRLLPEYISAIMTPAQVPPGEQMQIALTLNSEKVPEWGITHDNFYFLTREGEEPLEMESFCIITEDFNRLTPGQRLNAPICSASPARTDLGQISADAILPVEFTIKNEGKSPLLIRRVQVVDDALTDVEISTTKIKPGKKAKLSFKVNAAAATTEFINARVSLITNDPENPFTVVRVTAEIVK